MPNDEDEINLLDDTPGIEEVSEPKRPKPRASAHDPHKHLTRIDPILMEKLNKIEKDESGYEQKYVDGVPVFSARRESSPILGVLGFLFTIIVGFGGIRMYMGEPLVPVALKEMILGKPEPIILPPARYTIVTNIVGYEVAVNGEKQTLFNNQFEYPAGDKPVTLTVSRAGYSTFTTQVTPATGTHATIQPVLNQVLSTGFLTYETVPEARLTLFQSGNKIAEYNTPINGVKVPVGTYQVVLENSFIGFRKEQIITIEEWKTTSFRISLDSADAASPQAGAALPAITPVGAPQ